MHRSDTHPARPRHATRARSTRRSDQPVGRCTHAANAGYPDRRTAGWAIARIHCHHPGRATLPVRVYQCLHCRCMFGWRRNVTLNRFRAAHRWLNSPPPPGSIPTDARGERR
jgi:hypothetical protein